MELVELVHSPLRQAQHASLEDLYRRSNLTQRQLLMWIGQTVGANVPDLNMPSLFIIDGRLDEAAFRRAVQDLVDSCDSLRTVVRDEGGVPRQVVEPHLDAAVEVVDLRDNPAALRDMVRERALRPFALDRALVSFLFVHLADDRCAWFVNMHHLIGDGWSVRLLFDHLSALYLLEVAQPGGQHRLQIASFSDYVARERAYAETPGYEDDRAYWARTLGESEPVLFYGQPVTSTEMRAHRVQLCLGTERTQRLHELAEMHGDFWGPNAAMQNLLATVLFGLLYRIGPNPQPTLAMAFHNRPRELRDTVGLLMQTLPLRLDVGDGDSFYTLLEQITETGMKAVEHSGYAVANPMHRRAWEVVLNFLPTDFATFAGHALQHEWVFPEYVNAALTVTVHDFGRKGALYVDFDMRDDVFDERHRTLISSHFLAMFDALLENVDTPIQSVDILSDDEKAELWALGALAEEAPAVTGTYVEWFEATARRRAEHDAMRQGSQRVTYAELNARANQIAHHLRGLGAGPGQLVGVYLRPGLSAAAAVLGVLKSGAGYLPLDAGYPADRLSYMLEDGDSPIVVTQLELVGRLALGERQVVVIDDGEDMIALDRCPTTNLPPVATLDDIAYIIYTSGSTGRPKGVRIQHRSLVAFLRAMDGVWIDADDIVPWTSPLSFDLHVGDLLLPLVTGATSVAVSREIAADGARLKALLEETGVTAYFATPATFRILIDCGWQGHGELDILCGGEAMTAELAGQLTSRARTVQNVYGPSETTCYVVAHLVTEGRTPMPIGRPLRGVRLHVVDSHGRLQPLGMPGELVIGGPQVGFDYLNQPALTAEKFRSDIYSGGASGRVYHSGDLVRMLEDGVIEYLGRIDHQVKIRGYRIELGEIESRLSQHPAVRENLVMAREDTPGDKRLVGYVVLAPEVDPAATVGELKDFLRHDLPDFMVPAAFVVMPAMPLSPNGKIDRKSLPAPSVMREAAADVDAPRDLLQFQITKIFEDALGIQPVGIHDNFFELGGNSLQAVKLMAAIERVLDRQLPSLMTVFEAPTAQQLAAVLSRDGWQPALPSIVPLQPKGDKTPFFCVHAFIGDVCRDLGRHSGTDHPFYGLQPRGLDGRDEPLRSIHDMAAFYISEMRKIQPAGPYCIGGYSFGGLVATEMAAQLRDLGQEVALLAVIDTGPVNMTPKSLRGRLQAALNAPLIALEKLLNLVKEQPPHRLLGAIHTRLKNKLAKRRMSARAPESTDEVALVERMYGMSRWPRNYQRIAHINLLAMLRYVPRSFDGKLTLIRRRGQMHRLALEDAHWGWNELAPEVEVHYVDGNHDEIMVEPGVRQVGHVLEECLRKTQTAG